MRRGLGMTAFITPKVAAVSIVIRLKNPRFSAVGLIIERGN
jgi:hypothetical protein